jgi:predicted transcriptional regulator
MTQIKDISIKAIKNLREPCSVEDIMYELNVIAQVMDGYKDARDGKTISTEKLLNKIKKWGK